MSLSFKSRKNRRRAHHAQVPPVIPGAPTIVMPVEPRHSPDQIMVMGYGPEGCEEITVSKPEDIMSFAKKWPVIWVDIDGLGNAEITASIAKVFELDGLVLEDIMDVCHFPKIEEYDKYLFMILKNGVLGDVFQTEQISLIFTRHIIITFQERPGDSFEQLRQRIRKGNGRIRKFGSDYLLYAIIDAVIESYYPILHAVKTRLDAVEDIFVEASSHDVIRQIHDIKSDLLFLHSAIWPIHDITVLLAHDDMTIISPGISHYLRDCQDQAKRVTDLSEFYRMIASDLMATYLAFNDSKANEVMKILTMVTAIFIPLSFITGLYGMNFDRSASKYNMPELGSPYGYPIVVMVMIVIASGILLMFKRKGWLKSNRL